MLRLAFAVLCLTVGLTAAEATERGVAVRVADYDLGHVAGASLHADDYRGRARLVIDDSRDVVIGFTVVGDDVAELLHAATVAIVGEVPVARLQHAVPAYPTMSELWLRLLETDRAARRGWRRGCPSARAAVRARDRRRSCRWRRGRR